jgi:protein SCO1/2
MKRIVFVILLSSAFLLDGSCGKRETDETVKSFQAVGVVVSLDQENRSIVIDHEELPGFMAAMKMRFTLSDPSLFQGVKADDKVNFTITPTESRYVITELRVLE